MKNKLLNITAFIAGTAIACYALSEKLTLKTYNVKTNKVNSSLKILHVSDLHSSSYGKNQEELLHIIDEICPDVIMLTGDILDNRKSNFSSLDLLCGIAGKYSCYYVSGNHEVYTGHLPKIKELISKIGITVLSGAGQEAKIKNEKIFVCGIDDPMASPDEAGRMWEEQLIYCDKILSRNEFSVLLTPRPEPVNSYSDTGFDLILSGHAHGGQVRIPHIMNGLWAPHQSIFPKYAGGKYVLDNGSTMVVSRGLSTYVRPRVFNRPELVLVNIIPKK